MTETENQLSPDAAMVCDLLEQVKTAHTILALHNFKELSFEEKEELARAHPGAHAIIGDFEIRCLHPEKYGLNAFDK